MFDEYDNMLDIGFDQLDFGIGDFTVAFKTLDDSLITFQNSLAKFVQIVDQIVVRLSGKNMFEKSTQL